MKDFNDLKYDYENIRASDELRERVKNTMKKENRKNNVWKSCIGLAASLIIMLMLVVNFIPSFAYAMSDIPVFAPIIKVITFGRYESADNGYSAKVITPRIEGLLDKELEKRLNDELKENANAIILAYEQDIKQLKEEFGDETVHMGVESDYIIKTDNENILALDVYLLNVAGSSSTKHTFYNLDKKTGELLTLKGLFKDHADYVTVLSDYIKNEMIRRNQEEQGLFWIDGETENFEGFKQIKADQNFYINNDGQIVICFDKYDVAAGAQGSPEFVIPDNIVKAILK
ncbi:DUF3298 and DUF4163 domain-containing protein [Clostridium aminobutyricum]|uniref:DUF3298 domain-containing protein n=1 Tax=Clostridium aminobutyricum TaxID=33953 RepID=A0A939IHI9_CLOAM|nr:DUF3298 and DUF4163 domain-containing protein [Clostridium aminobutyricum]MBN7773832.1 DUF3298 domain-containing protein [Clostridium aminobutyricum]